MTAEAPAIRVLVAEDMHIVRGALVALLRLEPDIDVVTEVASGLEILPAARAKQAQVAVIDTDLPGKDGLDPACHDLARRRLSATAVSP